MSTTPACDSSHTLSFQIGGKLFPVASQDFVKSGNGNGCAANVEAIPAPNMNASLYSWRLGEAFLRNNLVAFYYGNLTDLSAVPPRMGFLSLEDPSSAPQRNSAVRSLLGQGGCLNRGGYALSVAALSIAPSVIICIGYPFLILCTTLLWCLIAVLQPKAMTDDSPFLVSDDIFRIHVF